MRLVLATLAALLTVPAGAETALTEADLAAIQQGVSQRLIDPGSAIFSLITAAPPRPGGITAVCGLVNAKNRFGGYVGDNIFQGMLRKDGDSLTFQVDILSNSEVSARVAVDLCKEHGVPF